MERNRRLSRVAHWIGRSPIHPILFVAAKAGFAICYGFLALYPFGVRFSTVPLPGVKPLAHVLLVVSLAFLALSFKDLGTSARVGLPKDPTRLKTTGLYRFTRNPMYLALFAGCLASCLYVPHPLNIASAAVTIVLHDRIVRSEERFLEGRFGDAWRAYRARVRRYL
jgi:protein-S-isoprenylcysteine O-methyltransferase Ste14